MSTAAVTIHLPDRSIPATLSTERSESSYGHPVLVAGVGGSFPSDRPTVFGVGDATDWGVVACLLLEVDRDPETLLEQWNAACASYRERMDLPTLAEAFLDAGGWEDGSRWVHTDPDRDNLVDELDRAPLERAVVEHHVENPDVEPVEGASWTFPDGSGVVEVAGIWDVFGPDHQTASGYILTPEERDRRAAS